MSQVSHEGARLLVRQGDCRECTARESASRWVTADGFPRPDTALPRGPAPAPPASPAPPPVARLRPVPSGPVVVDPSHDLLWRRFWLALWIVLGSAGLAFAAVALGDGRGAHVVAARALGWPALVLPVGVLVLALRRRGPSGRSPDLVLVLLGLALEAATVTRLQEAFGTLFWVP